MRSREGSAPNPLGSLDARVFYFLALFLRVGLGLGLLNSGLVGFHIQQAGGGSPFLQMFGAIPGGDPIFQFIPYLQMIVGLALVLGFFTTVAAVAAAVLSLIQPFSQTVGLLAGGMVAMRQGPFRFDPSMASLFSIGGTSTLLLNAVVLWLSAGITTRGRSTA